MAAGQAFTPMRPFVFQSPYNPGTLAAYWWVSADALTNNGAYVTNWIDRIQQATWSQYGDPTNCPNATALGVQFNYTNKTTLTNYPGIVAGVTNNTHYIVMQRDAASGLFHDFLDYANDGTLGWIWNGSDKSLEVFAGSGKAQVGDPGTNLFFDMAFTSDYINNQVIGYTNGVACVTNLSTTIGGTWRIMGGIPASGFFQGYIKELIIFTNYVMNSNEIYILHKYGTNQYLFTP